MTLGLSRRLFAAAAACAVCAGLSFAPAFAAAPAVSVLYAGSLATLNDQVLAPAFGRADGVGYSGHGGGSLGLAQEIVGGQLTADVFESVGTGALAAVGPKIMPWSVSFGSQRLVLMYNPKGKYAPRFRAIAQGKAPLKSLFTLLQTPGLKLGRTNPGTDPQGQAFVLMVKLAALQFHLPASAVTKILGPIDNPDQLFGETGLPAELQAGGIDAASGFLPEALALKLPYILLPPSLDFASSGEARTYARVSFVLPTSHQVVRGAPLAMWAGPLFESGSHTALGVRWVEFLLSATGQKLLRQQGYTAVTPAVFGRTGLVPAALRKEMRAIHG